MLQAIVILLGCPAAAISLLCIGVYAIRSPEELRRLTLLRYRMGPETPKGEVRLLGGIMIASAGFVLWLALNLFRNVPAFKALAIYSVLAFWYLCAPCLLAQGFFALVSPAKWMNSWGRGRMRGMDSPVVLRIAGASMILVGGSSAVQGVQMVRNVMH
jgi:hypothetical protein